MSFFKGRGFSFELNKKTYIMGILNITADSFFDGGLYNSIESSVKRAKEIEKEGADIIDIGAQSTGPDSVAVSEAEELVIIKKFLPSIMNAVSIPVSVDTFYPEVAEYSLSKGANIINDVSGKINFEMLKTVKKYNAGWIITHNPSSASEICNFENCGGVVNAVNSFFENSQLMTKQFGISNENICFDMGIGFGKSYEDNINLIKNISMFKNKNIALMTALSCKRMTNEKTGAQGYDRVFPTIAANTFAISGKTDFIRVHHVKEAVLAAKMADEIVR